jgi:uncharacterized protein (TIGR02996 family)
MPRFVDGTQFLRVELNGTMLHLHWGEGDAEGRHRVIPHDDLEAANAAYRARLQRLLDDGYRIVDEDPETAQLARTPGMSESTRFFFVHRAQKLFAWCEVNGSNMIYAEGPLSEESSTAAQSGYSPGGAAAARDTYIGKLLARGFELSTFGAKSQLPSHAELVFDEALERAIADDPDDDDAWSVLEDWILQRDDPRAEFTRLAKAGLDVETAVARAAVLPLLLGDNHAMLAYILQDTARWRAGYIVECAYFEQRRNQNQNAQTFYAAPATRLLRTLKLELIHPNRVRDHVALVDRSPCARTLRRLVVQIPRIANPDALRDEIASMPVPPKCAVELVVD